MVVLFGPLLQAPSLADISLKGDTFGQACLPIQRAGWSSGGLHSIARDQGEVIRKLPNSDETFILDFGKNKGKKLTEVSKEYISWLVNQQVYKSRPALHAALLSMQIFSKTSQSSSVDKPKEDKGHIKGHQHKESCKASFHDREVLANMPGLDVPHALIAHLPSAQGSASLASDTTVEVGDGEHEEDQADAPDVPSNSPDPFKTVKNSEKAREEAETGVACSHGSKIKVERAWKAAHSHVSGLRKTTITSFFQRTGKVEGLTGVFSFSHTENPATPSPKKIRRSNLLRDELSWIRSTLPPHLRNSSLAPSIVSRFVRPLPCGSATYNERLTAELELIDSLGFEECFLQVLKLLELAEGMPYIVRGSAAGSLVCYMLGITHIDPVKEKMSLSRFMNALRKDLPDIDIDFPHNERDKIFERIFRLFPSQSARISNHVKFRERSAKLESARRLSLHCRIPRGVSPGEFFQGPVKLRYQELASSLVGRFRCYSLHCGGLVILDGGKSHVPEEQLVKETRERPGERKFLDNQVKWDKRDCQERKLFKLDILSNRGLSHLWSISRKHVYEYPADDQQTAKLLQEGDVIGVIFCESPAMKKVLRILAPSNRRELALALGLVRPAAQTARKFGREDLVRGDVALVFDDDVINMLKELLGCSEASAELLRKAFIKGDPSFQLELERGMAVGNFTAMQVRDALLRLANTDKYSFCKSHAMGYAHLSWALAYEKAHSPAAFWKKHVEILLGDSESVYRPWVYKREALLAGASLAEQQQPSLRGGELEPVEQFMRWGVWLGSSFLPGCFFDTSSSVTGEETTAKFRGVWAAGRRYKNKVFFITLGVGNKQFVDLVCDVSNLRVGMEDFDEAASAAFLWGDG